MSASYHPSRVRLDAKAEAILVRVATAVAVGRGDGAAGDVKDIVGDRFEKSCNVLELNVGRGFRRRELLPGVGLEKVDVKLDRVDPALIRVVEVCIAAAGMVRG